MSPRVGQNEETTLRHKGRQASCSECIHQPISFSHVQVIDIGIVGREALIRLVCLDEEVSHCFLKRGGDRELDPLVSEHDGLNEPLATNHPTDLFEEAKEENEGLIMMDR